MSPLPECPWYGCKGGIYYAHGCYERPCPICGPGGRDEAVRADERERWRLFREEAEWWAGGGDESPQVGLPVMLSFFRLARQRFRDILDGTAEPRATRPDCGKEE